MFQIILNLSKFILRLVIAQFIIDSQVIVLRRYFIGTMQSSSYYGTAQVFYVPFERQLVFSYALKMFNQIGKIIGNINMKKG